MADEAGRSGGGTISPLWPHRDDHSTAHDAHRTIGWHAPTSSWAWRTPYPGLMPTRTRACHQGPSTRGSSERLRLSRQRRIDDDIPGDLDGALVGVALAVEPRVPLQRAAQVELRID